MSLIILLSGIIGNLLNCLVFAQRSLRTKPCVVYFFVASIFNLIAIFSGIIPRALQCFFSISDQTQTISVLCKFQLFVVFSARTISSWLIALASIDRYLISSADIVVRRMSNLKNTHFLILIISIILFLFWLEVGYCFDANLIGTPQKCYAKSVPCRIFNDIAQSFITTIIPSTIMLIVGLFTIRNVRKSKKIGVLPITIVSQGNGITRRNEQSLTIMLIAQVILLTVFNLPQAGQKFYLTYSFYQTKTTSQQALETLLFNFVLFLTYISNCMPFYIYTITGTLFRKTLFKLLKSAIKYFH
ncbi:unnamed protein product [Adineta steineri]|uniref:G-protein coupled receptors family 1 profile domain-containing protein n=1 Tax=Adineta steineri TaxID=433720 RepID=A0A815BUJ5_9BILA|nr:unnamed protein product [Adineta steineri]CAF3822342.1 unnamed protein product [Adineta steineri]